MRVRVCVDVWELKDEYLCLGILGAWGLRVGDGLFDGGAVSFRLQVFVQCELCRWKSWAFAGMYPSIIYDCILLSRCEVLDVLAVSKTRCETLWVRRRRIIHWGMDG